MRRHLQTGHVGAVALPRTKVILLVQVCDHLQKVGKSCGIWVVPIVGGISPAKQERLLKKQPEVTAAGATCQGIPAACTPACSRRRSQRFLQPELCSPLQLQGESPVVFQHGWSFSGQWSGEKAA